MKWIFLALILSSAWSPVCAFGASSPDDVVPDWAFVASQLKAAGFQKKFIKDLKATYEPKHFEQTLELNILLFLRKRDDHGVQVSNDAVKTVRAFIKNNEPNLARAEAEYGVPASVMASLMWIESRHGANQGRFHVPSVYLHLLQAPRRDVIKHLQAHAFEFSEVVTKKNREEIRARTKTKANWALGELKALQQTWKKDPERVKNLRGSFAGAFGIPQFIPSSYLRWARTKTKAKSADLNSNNDAIESVAFYLHDNGWKKSKPDSYVKALLKYNNSKDYAHAILKLAGEVDEQSSRPARRLSTSIKDLAK